VPDVMLMVIILDTCVIYADDLLLSASVAGLQHMRNICHTFGQNNSISFNHSNTICMKVNPHW